MRWRAGVDEADDSMSYMYISCPSWKCLRRCLLAVIVVIFLPIIPLLTKPRLLRSDVIAEQTQAAPLEMTTSYFGANCVATTTSPAHQGRVIAVKRMSAGRMGNDMFVYASLVGIAARNKMLPIYNCETLEHTFQVTGTGHYVLKPPATNVIEESAFR